MSSLAAVWRNPGRLLAGRYARLRAAHPVRVLRWLRTGVLITLAVAALLYLVVTAEAHRDLAAAGRTTQAVRDIDKALVAADDARAALERVFAGGDVELIGTGTDFAIDTAQVSTYLTSAAGGNAAGREGITQIQFVHGQLTTVTHLAQVAVDDYDRSVPEAVNAPLSALTDPDQTDPDTHAGIPDTGGLSAALKDLRDLEQGALDAQRGSRWLAPAYFWWLLVGPVIVMLLLVAATAYVVARHFRRLVSPLLGAALLTAAAVQTTVGVLNAEDARKVTSNPWAGHPATMATALFLLAAAAVLAYLAYWPRLAEYRFQRS